MAFQTGLEGKPWYFGLIAGLVVGTLVYKELKNLPMSDQFLIFCGLVMGYYFRRSPDKD